MHIIIITLLVKIQSLYERANSCLLSQQQEYEELAVLPFLRKNTTCFIFIARLFRVGFPRLPLMTPRVLLLFISSLTRTGIFPQHPAAAVAALIDDENGGQRIVGRCSEDANIFLSP